jgi:superfamily II DNA or RNA helicase
MAEVFNRAGIASVAVDASTDDAERAAALERLRRREINCLFAVQKYGSSGLLHWVHVTVKSCLIIL